MLLRGVQFLGTFWFAPKKLHFGSSAVPHYNAVSRVVASLVTRWNSTPTMGYFGDSRIPSVILVRAPLLGVHVEPRSVGVSMSLTLDVRTLLSYIEELLPTGLLPRSGPPPAPRLAGKLNFAQFRVPRKAGA